MRRIIVGTGIVRDKHLQLPEDQYAHEHGHVTVPVVQVGIMPDRANPNQREIFYTIEVCLVPEEAKMLELGDVWTVVLERDEGTRNDFLDTMTNADYVGRHHESD